jgi:serine/threonine protein kinase
MELATGNLASFAESKGLNEELAGAMLQQILSALDFLDSKHVCHRDVKPQNILCWDLLNQDPVFKLADFGLAVHSTLATVNCGTKYYQAPEQQPGSHGLQRGPKMDVWSLFATFIAVHPAFAFPPAEPCSPEQIQGAVLTAALFMPALAPMARLDPKDRASAADMLKASFNGQGLAPRRNLNQTSELATALRAVRRRKGLVHYPRRQGVGQRKTPVPAVKGAPASRPPPAARAKADTPKRTPLSAQMDWERSSADVGGFRPA